ncbi:MAG TPA: ribosome small subunit-dependent GTPase A, partial [Parachlamydiales bacterium]|nr:ribosome small subunit-dependent GTPase A [Parachlamydiales bacterium]
MPGGGYCIDTPGIRGFGIWGLDKDDVTSHFVDIQQFSSQCKFPDCMHI